MNTLTTYLEISSGEGSHTLVIQADFDIDPIFDGSGHICTGFDAEILAVFYYAGAKIKPLPDFLLDDTITESLKAECVKQARKEGEQAILEAAL